MLHFSQTKIMQLWKIIICGFRISHMLINLIKRNPLCFATDTILAALDSNHPSSVGHIMMILVLSITTITIVVC